MQHVLWCDFSGIICCLLVFSQLKDFLLYSFPFILGSCTNLSSEFLNFFEFINLLDDFWPQWCTRLSEGQKYSVFLVSISSIFHVFIDRQCLNIFFVSFIEIETHKLSGVLCGICDVNVGVSSLIVRENWTNCDSLRVDIAVDWWANSLKLHVKNFGIFLNFDWEFSHIILLLVWWKNGLYDLETARCYFSRAWN